MWFLFFHRPNSLTQNITTLSPTWMMIVAEFKYVISAKHIIKWATSQNIKSKSLFLLFSRSSNNNNCDNNLFYGICFIISLWCVSMCNRHVKSRFIALSFSKSSPPSTMRREGVKSEESNEYDWHLMWHSRIKWQPFQLFATAYSKEIKTKLQRCKILLIFPPFINDKNIKDNLNRLCSHFL